MTDFNNLNTIVYCETCDTGVHLRCYGLDPEIMDSSENKFHCDICIHMRRRKEFDEIKCFICKRSGEGMMKFEDDFKPYIEPCV